jgi:hypothetical protein
MVRPPLPSSPLRRRHPSQPITLPLVLGRRRRMARRNPFRHGGQLGRRHTQDVRDRRPAGAVAAVSVVAVVVVVALKAPPKASSGLSGAA